MANIRHFSSFNCKRLKSSHVLSYFWCFIEYPFWHGSIPILKLQGFMGWHYPIGDVSQTTLLFQSRTKYVCYKCLFVFCFFASCWNMHSRPGTYIKKVKNKTNKAHQFRFHAGFKSSEQKEQPLSNKSFLWDGLHAICLYKRTYFAWRWRIPIWDAVRRIRLHFSCA